MKKSMSMTLIIGFLVFVIAPMNDWAKSAARFDRVENPSVATGWVKLHPFKKTTQEHNAYTVNSKIGTFGGFEAKNVRCGDLATDAVIPDGEYFVTFWVTGTTRSGRPAVEVEHKQKMRFVGGDMVGEIRLTVALGTITSAGVSYPA